MDLNLVTSTDFKALLHQSLQVHFTPDVTLTAELVEVTELGGYSPLERMPFSIVIRTDQKKEYYNQGTFVVEHPQLGALPVFLVPLGLDGKGMRYEAVFS
ncbi:DUF6916 family protein [Telluribacter humicola]|uniref:DUF6916 family protein n=1 Tax=Telluribacter humicola TaxID=1720261 RepID=UPI001A9705C5|nr:hypothetical protein [Telluribacter humicola]